MATDDKQLSEAQIIQRREAALKHGLNSGFAQTGDERALSEPQRGRLVELRADLATPDGVRQAMIDRAAQMVLVCEWADDWLTDKAKREGGERAFEAKSMQRYFTAQAEARRALESLIKTFTKGDSGISAADVLQAVRRDQDG